MTTVGRSLRGHVAWLLVTACAPPATMVAAPPAATVPAPPSSPPTSSAAASSSAAATAPPAISAPTAAASPSTPLVPPPPPPKPEPTASPFLGRTAADIRDSLGPPKNVRGNVWTFERETLDCDRRFTTVLTFKGGRVIDVKESVSRTGKTCM